jgi:pimeloyl-ACP methyl ester carboxylesterase
MSNKQKVLEHVRALAERENITASGLESLFPATHFESVLGPVEPGIPEEALESLERAQRGQEVDDDQSFQLEAIILPKLRPVLDVRNDTFDPPGGLWADLTTEKDKIDAAIRAVGRLNLVGSPLPYGGTAFVVGPGLLMTNRHVAQLFTQGLGRRGLSFTPGMGSLLDLKEEVIPSTSRPLEIVRTLLIHPFWDMAVLEVRGLPEQARPLRLRGTAPEAVEQRMVVVIGYPAFDPRNDVRVQSEVFHGVFEKKRLLPGKLMTYREVRSFRNNVRALLHDCSTLGGNSGSAVIDVATGTVLALHFGGVYLDANFSVPAWELAADARVVDCGVLFAEPRSGERPEWLSKWDEVEAVAADKPVTVPVAAPVPTPVPAPKPVRATEAALPLASDWFERIPVREIAGALRREAAPTEGLLREALLPETADQMTMDLRAVETFSTAEGIFFPDADPNLPEIVFLHGLMGGHLDRPGFLGERVWLNPVAILAGSAAARLSLGPDGVSEQMPGNSIEAAGHLQLVYAAAALAWKQNRFVVHQFSYDWRKGVDLAADRLQTFLNALARPGRRFVLVGHSMGGVIACRYAQRHGEWSDLVQKAIFMGSPLKGSFAPMEAVIGTYPFVQKLAGIAIGPDRTTEYRQMAKTLPGLIDLLADPATFPSAEPMYAQAKWPDGIVPAQRWLDQSKALKRAVVASPLLDRTTLLVSLGHPTVSSAVLQGGFLEAGPKNGKGDGTVPAASAVVDGVPAFQASYEHSMLPLDPAVIAAVPSLIRTGTCALRPVAAGDLAGTLETLESVNMADTAAAGEVRERMLRGTLEQRDVLWLLTSSEQVPTELPAAAPVAAAARVGRA